MARQSDSLADETAAMRSFDRALQAAAGLPPKAAGRVLRYIADRVADEQAANAQLQAGNGTVTISGSPRGASFGGGSVYVAGGGAGTNAAIGPGGGASG